MKTNPLKEGALTEKSAGLGTVTRKMVRARAAELAVIDGHLSSDATKSHYAQAKRELNETVMESPTTAPGPRVRAKSDAPDSHVKECLGDTNQLTLLATRAGIIKIPSMGLRPEGPLDPTQSHKLAVQRRISSEGRPGRRPARRDFYNPGLWAAALSHLDRYDA